jgi:3-oxoacyl-[acyl-carrier protein] reductase
MLKQGNRVAVVTGGGQGIGAVTVRRLAEDGALVIALDLDGEAARKSTASLPYGGDGYACDITDRAVVYETIDEIAERYGRIDILVNNAGITRDALFHKMTSDEWDSVLTTHLTGAFNVTQAAARHMVERRYGRLVFVSSRAALGNRGQANYSAAKAGMLGMAKTLAIELGQFGITANAVGPGFIETAMTRAIIERTGESWEDLAGRMRDRAAVGRIGQPEDIAEVVAFFALPASGFVTGQTIYATGSPAS